MENLRTPAGDIEDEHLGTAATAPNGASSSGVPMTTSYEGLSSPTMRATSAAGESTAIATTAILSPWVRLSSSSHASVDRHGGHQVAHISTTTTLPVNASGFNSRPPMCRHGQWRKCRGAVLGAAANVVGIQPFDALTLYTPLNDSAEVCLESLLTRRLAPRNVEAGALVIRPREAEVLGTRNQHIVDEDYGIPAHAKPCRHWRVAVLLGDDSYARTKFTRDVLDQQTCWIRQRSRERPANQSDGYWRRLRKAQHRQQQREMRGRLVAGLTIRLVMASRSICIQGSRIRRSHWHHVHRRVPRDSRTPFRKRAVQENDLRRRASSTMPRGATMAPGWRLW